MQTHNIHATVISSCVVDPTEENFRRWQVEMCYMCQRYPDNSCTLPPKVTSKYQDPSPHLQFTVYNFDIDVYGNSLPDSLCFDLASPGLLLYPDIPAKMETTSQEAFCFKYIPQQVRVKGLHALILAWRLSSPYLLQINTDVSEGKD